MPAESPELLHDLDIEASTLQRHAVPLSECTRTADRIDVASGKVILEQVDFSLGSSAPLRFERVWLSCSTYRGALGRGWHHGYDLALARGAETVAVRTAEGRVVWLPAPRIGGSTYAPDERLTLWRDKYSYVLRDAAGTEHRFVPHRARAAFVLASRRSGDGQELRFGYDHHARLVRITDRRGADLELEHDAHGRIFEIRAADPVRAGKRVVLVQFAYDPHENLRRASDAFGQARRYGYELGLLVQYDDRNGCSTRFEWDGLTPKARCVHSWVDSNLRELRLQYLDAETRVRNSLGYETSYAHDGVLVHRIVDAAGGVRELTRDSSRRLERIVDALGHEQRRVYDGRGNLIELRAADGSCNTFDYDDRDRLRRARDALNGLWELDYDGRGRLTRMADPLGQVTRLDHRGRWLVGIVQAGDRKTAFAYDVAGNLIARTAADGCSTRYGYDAWGRLTSVTDPHGNREQRDYDLLGRLVRVQFPDGSRCELSYDAEGNLVRMRDAQHDARFTHQGTGRLSSRSEGGHTVCFEYDTEEQLVAIVNENGKLFRIGRGPTGAVTETIGFDGCTRIYTRDPAGRVVRVQCGEAFSEYELDPLGRVTEVHHSDGAFEGYRYRADGGLIGAWNQSGTLAFERDAVGRVTREEQGDQWVEYRYDAMGRCVELRSSLGTRQVLERDAAGRLRRIADTGLQLESRILRDALGLEIERTLIGGARSAWQRDTFGRPTAFRLETADGELVHKLVYEWHHGGRLRRCTDNQRGTTEYGYDAIGELAWLRTGSGSYQLRMPDAVGNVFAREDRRDREYGPAGQLLVRSTEEGEAHADYDAHGYLVARREPDGRHWGYTWSASGLLQRVTAPDGEDVVFGYDALGRRMWKKYRGQTTRFVWSGMVLLHEWVEKDTAPLTAAEVWADEDAPTLLLTAQHDARGTRSAPITWVHDPDSGRPLAKIGTAGRFAIVTDHVGTPRLMLDEAGRPSWVVEETISGDVHVLEGERRACSLRGGGMYEDLETSLYCGGTPARYYDARAGTYICQGPITARPKLRAYGREPPPWSREFQLAPPHAWLLRVDPPMSARLLPSALGALGPSPPSGVVSLLMAAGPARLADALLRRAFEDGDPQPVPTVRL